MAEAESDLARSGDDVSISEEVHSLQISIDIQAIPGETDGEEWSSAGICLLCRTPCVKDKY